MITKFGLAACGIAILAGTGLLASPLAAQTQTQPAAQMQPKAKAMTKKAAPKMQTKEVATAAQHAGLAAQSADLKTTQMHLHHVINCLVGADGAGFDEKAGNPCNGMGRGAIWETSSPAARAPLQAALDQAKDGVKQDNLAVAQLDGRTAQDILNGKTMRTGGKKKTAAAKPATDGMNHPM
jgi:hypothetical protein